ncbi:MAG: hypothetical protein KF690_11625, partial [Bacteroidetes bacterium]|nr:hypothetical protein [Bacteroidota bacterium]
WIPSSALRQTAGSVGINTAPSANYLLWVSDNRLTAQPTVRISKQVGPQTSNLALQVQASNATTNTAAEFSAVSAAGTTAIGLNAAANGPGTNYAAIFPSGNVGIGTAIPAYQLDVAGTTRLGGDATVVGTLNLSGNRILAVGTPTSATDAATKGYVDGVASGTNFIQNQSAIAQTGSFRLSGNGSMGTLGIGIATPNYLADIVGGTGGTETILLHLRSNSTAANTATALRISNTTVASGNSGFADFVVNRLNQVNIRSTGNVGINEPTPQNKLHVGGGITARGMSLLSHGGAECVNTGNIVTFQGIFSNRIYVPPGTPSVTLWIRSMSLLSAGEIRLRIGSSSATVMVNPGTLEWYSITLNNPDPNWQDLFIEARVLTGTLGTTCSVCQYNLVTN